MTADEKKIHELFDELVPASGKADTIAVEIVRAVTRIGYRWWNDGDMIGVGYGKETCNPAARYLLYTCDRGVGDAILHMWSNGHNFCTENEYEGLMQKLNKEVLRYLEKHPAYKQIENYNDMFDYYDKYEDVDDTDDEDDWF